MNIQLKTEPFEHIIIENTFSDLLWKGITEELENIYQYDLFCGDKNFARDEFGNALKTNKRVFLKDLSDYKESSLYFSKFELFDKIKESLDNTDIDKKHWFLYNLKHNCERIQRIKTLISYYGNNDNYKSHIDTSYITCLTWYYKEPKKFRGGDLVFENFDNYTISCNNHRTVIIPSFLLHKINEVELQETGCGRFSLTHFCSN